MTALNPQLISKIAYNILDEDIKENSIIKAFSRAGKKIKKVDNKFYEIMGLGREELDKYEAKSEHQEDSKERYYDSGDQFDFYLDIKKEISIAKSYLFIIDSYINEGLLEVYLEKLPPGIEIKILLNSKNPRGNFMHVARMFARKKGVNFEVRESLECHDRAIFIDKTGWVIGCSIKDNAKNKPAYMIGLRNPQILEKIYRRIWLASQKLI
jgi:hypothetical protein